MAHTKYNLAQAVYVKSELKTSIRDAFQQIRTYHGTHTDLLNKINKLRASEKYQRLTNLDKQNIEGFIEAVCDQVWHGSPSLTTFMYKIDGVWKDAHNLSHEDNEWLRANELTNPDALRAFVWKDAPDRFWTDPVPSYRYEQAQLAREAAEAAA